VQVSRQKWSQVMVWAKQGPEGLEKARALLESIKGLPKAVMNEILDAVAPVEMAGGLGRIPRRELEPNQPMRMQGNTGGGSKVPKGLVNVVEEEPSRLGRNFARYDKKTGEETFAARLEKNGHLQMAWIGDGQRSVLQIADNLAEIQRATGQHIPEIYGLASDGFELALRKERFSHELYEQVLSRRLGGKWKIETPRREGYELVPVKDAKFDIKATRIGD
jgi:hypothetical protein